jgi:hypothetical protein
MALILLFNRLQNGSEGMVLLSAELLLMPVGSTGEAVVTRYLQSRTTIIMDYAGQLIFPTRLLRSLLLYV